jgi:large subunit ribosomal protein L18
MIKKQHANQARLRRHQRVRKKVTGTSARPRLSVFRSGNQIYAQVIDDLSSRTVTAASSRDTELAGVLRRVAALKDSEDQVPEALKGIVTNRRVQQARAVGQLVAERAKALGIEQVVFDRGGYIYHGRVAALAHGAREAGLDF